MLPTARRLRSKGDFTAALRQGARTGTRRLVLHWVQTDEAHPTRVGFVVSKAVGNSVVRHRTQRRLRHLAADRLPLLPAEGGLLVVRALPAAAGSSSADLAADVDRGLRRLGLTGR
ncbi:ribonuclease P protein component [Paenibacillus sp. TRM 82003]|uniref:ribonuclease P protein component n=1 Tax=Kineococcus sp. TRM81007 TaxID=2925831 RepID=UPI001F5962D1|nr:ribonuclease P protein component [Kineococcus sp. TRM81007]MCI2240538.1 ribonuclease P protein component [Kineococcus sp. TRM81007]MCI3918917.1 ribonuclease P protein component [Paenibacillus sp. TRM 82003]